MGAIISKVQFDRVMSYIASAKSEGARLINGGGPPSDPKLAKGLFIEPTIFADVKPSMRIFKEEIFGPVLSVATANSLDEALKFANSVEYGLTRWARLFVSGRNVTNAQKTRYRVVEGAPDWSRFQIANNLGFTFTAGVTGGF